MSAHKQHYLRRFGHALCVGFASMNPYYVADIYAQRQDALRDAIMSGTPNPGDDDVWSRPATTPDTPVMPAVHHAYPWPAGSVDVTRHGDTTDAAYTTGLRGLLARTADNGNPGDWSDDDAYYNVTDPSTAAPAVPNVWDDTPGNTPHDAAMIGRYDALLKATRGYLPDYDAPAMCPGSYKVSEPATDNTCP